MHLVLHVERAYGLQETSAPFPANLALGKYGMSTLLLQLDIVRSCVLLQDCQTEWFLFKDKDQWCHFVTTFLKVNNLRLHTFCEKDSVHVSLVRKENQIASLNVKGSGLLHTVARNTNPKWRPPPWQFLLNHATFRAAGAKFFF